MILQPSQKRCLLRWADGARIAHAVARGLRRRDRHRCVLPASIYWQSGSTWSKSRRRPRGSAAATTTTQVTVASTRLGSPLASTAAARWHFAHQRSQRAGRRATAPGGAPKRGHQQDICNKPKRCRLRKRKINFFVRTHGYDGRGLPTAQHGCFSTNWRELTSMMA